MSRAPLPTAGTTGRWQKDVDKWAPNEVPHGRTVWVGSSIVRLWNLQNHVDDQDQFGVEHWNRGLGGARTDDLLRHYDRLIDETQPRQIVYYAGDNDLAENEHPARVAERVAEFFQRVLNDLPSCRIVSIPVKPSHMRWALIEAQRELQMRVLELECVAHVPANGLDSMDSFLGPDTGRPDERYLLGDGLHLNAQGYALLTSIVRPYLL